VINKRYAAKDPQGRPVEEWTDIVARVVDHVSNAEMDPTNREQFRHAATDIMLNREFIPNTPCLVNAGRENGQLAACFVLRWRPIACRFVSVDIMIDDADGTVASRVIFTAEKLMVIVATFAHYEWLLATWATGPLINQDERFSRRPS
jgi:hypothetical protein